MLGVGRAFAALSALLLAACSTGSTAAPSSGPPAGDHDASTTGDGGTTEDSGAVGDDDDDTPGPPSGAIAGAVTSYTYTFDVASAKATSKLAIDVAAPGGDCYTVGCRVDGGEDVLWSGAPPRSSKLEAGALSVCGPPVSAGATELSAVIPTVPVRRPMRGLDVGFSRKVDLAGGDFTYLLSWVGGCDLFGPCDPDPSRLSELHFDVTHPEGTIVLCPGKLTPGATNTKCDVTGTLAPTYSGFGIAADPKWVRTPYTSAAGVDVVMYEVPGGKIAANTDKASFGEFLAWLTNLLGPMPYGSELRFAGAPSAWLGFEHPANVILNEDLGDIGTGAAHSAQHVMMHETIHQYSGDRTTLASTSDFVWKEAISEYLAYVFEDEHRPAVEAVATRTYWDSISTSAEHRPRPTDGPAVQDFYVDVYGPGPMVLFLQLEPLVGRPAVLKGIQGFLSQPGARSVDDLRVELEKAASKHLVEYFEAWVVGPGAPEWPKFDVTTHEQSGGLLEVTVTQSNPSGRIYGCVVDIDINGKRASVDFGLAPASKVATTSIAFTGAASPITVDPDHKIVNRLIGAGLSPPSRPKIFVY